MKILVMLLIAGFVALGLVVLLVRRGAAIRKAQEQAYADFKKLPAIAKEFTTPEGAILCLEEAYRRRDIDAAIAAKDFQAEARLMLQKLNAPHDDELVATTAETLLASFRAHTTARWPNFDGLESFFTKRESHSDKIVVVTEVCRFPDGRFSEQRVLVAQTPHGWRVLNPAS